MTSLVERPARLFCSYSHLDDEFRQELELHLKALVRQGLVEFWSDRRLVPGDEWNRTISERLEAADIIVLLISVYFVNSEYCYQIELGRALERHREGSAVVVPVFVRACDCEGLPFSQLQGLPPDAKPVTTFPDRDSAWLLVAKGIRELTSSLKARRISPAPSTSSAPVLTDVLRYELQTYMRGLVTAAEREHRGQAIDLFASGERGREAIIPALTRWAQSPGARVVLLTGAPGSGKTWVLKHTAATLASKVLQDNRGPLPIYVPARRLPLHEPDCIAALESVVPEARVVLAEARRGADVLLFFDGMDEVAVNSTAEAAGFLAYLIRMLPVTTRFAVSVRTSAAEDLRNRLKVGGIKPVEYSICDVSQAQVRDFVESTPQRYRAGRAASSLLQQPLLLNLLKQAASGSDATYTSVVDLYDTVVTQLISQARAGDRDLSDISQEKMFDLLTGMAEHMYPRTTIELSRLILSRELPVDRWSEVLNNLAATRLITVDGREIVSFSHASFFDYFFARLLFREMLVFDARHLARTNLIYSYNINRFLIPQLLRERSVAISSRAVEVRERLLTSVNHASGPVLVNHADFVEFMLDARWRWATGFGTWVTAHAPDGTAVASDENIVPESTSRPQQAQKGSAVTGVSWYDAQQFARWVGGRLPGAKDFEDNLPDHAPEMLWTADWFDEPASLIAVRRTDLQTPCGVNPDVRHRRIGVMVVLPS